MALLISLHWVAVVAARRAGGMGPVVETCLGLCPFWFSRQVTGKVAVLLLALHAPGDACCCLTWCGDGGFAGSGANTPCDGNLLV